MGGFERARETKTRACAYVYVCARVYIHTCMIVYIYI